MSIALKETENSILFNSIINIFINSNFDCKIVFLENIGESEMYGNIKLPSLLKIDGKKNDLPDHPYINATGDILEYIILNNKIKKCHSKLEHSIINSFLLTLYNNLLLEEEDIDKYAFLEERFKIVKSRFSGYVLLPKEPTVDTKSFPVIAKPVVKPVEKPVAKPVEPVEKVDDFIPTKKSNKKKRQGAKVVLDMSFENDLMKRTFCGTVDEQKINYNNWYIKVDADKKCTAVNEKLKLYVPIVFSVEMCVENANNNKLHANLCKFLCCRMCHNIEGVKEAVRQHNILVKSKSFTPEQLREDLHCRVFQANVARGILNNKKVYDFSTLLECLANNDVDPKLILNETEYKNLLGGKQKK